MKQTLPSLQTTMVLLSLAVILPACEAVGSIFEAGMWTGIIVVVGIIALIIFIITRMGRKS